MRKKTDVVVDASYFSKGAKDLFVVYTEENGEYRLSTSGTAEKIFGDCKTHDNSYAWGYTVPKGFFPKQILGDKDKVRPLSFGAYAEKHNFFPQITIDARNTEWLVSPVKCPEFLNDKTVCEIQRDIKNLREAEKVVGSQNSSESSGLSYSKEKFSIFSENVLLLLSAVKDSKVFSAN